MESNDLWEPGELVLDEKSAQITDVSVPFVMILFHNLDSDRIHEGALWLKKLNLRLSPAPWTHIPQPSWHIYGAGSCFYHTPAIPYLCTAPTAADQLHVTSGKVVFESSGLSCGLKEQHNDLSGGIRTLVICSENGASLVVQQIIN